MCLAYSVLRIVLMFVNLDIKEIKTSLHKLLKVTQLLCKGRYVKGHCIK